MYLNDAVTVPNLTLGNYYVFNFDDHYEPQIHVITMEHILIGPHKNKLQNELNGCKIIRTNNNSIDIGYKKIYSHNDVYHSDIPHGYLPILKGAKVVFSERVHTCAATLILGGTAQYISASKRSYEQRLRIFDRLGAEEIFKRPVNLNLDFVESEKQKMKSALINALTNL